MKCLAISLVALTLLLCMQSDAFCREQYQMTQPPGPPPSAPIGSITAHTNLITPVGADFWKTGGGGILANSLPAGTVLTGTLQQNISSNKSNPGDVFSIVLPYGAQSEGKQIVPAGSKIIGVIKNVTPAKQLRFGQPGSLEISLQTLVLPDGRSVHFHGFIDYNANLDPRAEPKVRTAGPHVSDYGSYAKSFLLQFPAGLGGAMNARHRGADYSLQQGESIPVRVTENIGLPPPVAPPIGYPRPLPPAPSSAQQSSWSQYQQSLASGTVNAGTGTIPGQAYKEYAPINTSPDTSVAAGPQLSRIAPGGTAPEPGYLPASPQLRDKLPTQSEQTAAQGIRATPLKLDDSSL
jgi:hypothetical protein